MARGRRPRTPMIIAMVFIAWAVSGIWAFFAQLMMSSIDLASLPQAQQRLWRMTPDWITYVYATAVFAGLGASVALLLRRRSAVPLYAISLACVGVQFGYPLYVMDGIRIVGWDGTVLPGVILVIGAIELIYARTLARRRLLR